VEEEGGPWAVWLTYLACGLGGSVAAFLLTPAVKTAGFMGLAKAATFTLGASGAVFGLFVTSVLLKLTWSPRKLLEALILGQFVVQQVWAEVRNQVAIGATSNISHAAHLGGALAGVALIWLLSKIPEPSGGGKGGQKKR
jgi:membrane associated rhomboid family serine protease